MQYRRFGKTELQIPVISCGGMRYQQSWKDADPITPENQRNLEACIERALEVGVTHIETARGYGTSEQQLGAILPRLDRDRLIVQTKVSPFDDVQEFVKTFEHSMSLLKLDYVDLFAFHGVNNEAKLEAAKKCMDTARRWQAEGRVRHVGFSTHGSPELITKTIETDLFDYVNLHWYFIYQNNWPCVQAAKARDMGVFIISPNDKGGLLYKPSEKLLALCAPLHPMVFNGLFCLSRSEVHTLSCGVSRPEDFDIHLDMVRQLEQAEKLIAPVVQRLEAEMERTLGREWVATWQEGLPEWDATPGEINIPWVLRLYNLAMAYDMVEFGKMRYNLFENGGDWFPGKSCKVLDSVDAQALRESLKGSPHAAIIPERLRAAHSLLQGEARKRLSSA
jgi:predicted aldo/keto reductase-like oxidoreductase